MDAQTNLYKRLCSILTVDYNLIDEKENKKIFKSFSVLHKDYLISASKEARNIINTRDVQNKYNLMITIYNRKIKEHQALTLLIQLFEIAMRTQAAIVLANKFSTPNNDNWYNITATNSKHQKLINKISNRAITISKTITPNMTTFDMFHMLTMGDVKGLYMSHWGSFKGLFNNTAYKLNAILPLTTRDMFMSRFNRINKYRNELYHGNPGTSGWGQVINDIEEILIQLGYNVEEAINNIDPNHTIISLRYVYNN